MKPLALLVALLVVVPAARARVEECLPCPSEAGGCIQGRVIDGSGKGLGGAVASLIARGAGAASPAGGAVRMTASTSSDGWYFFAGVPMAEYRVRVSAAGHSSGESPLFQVPEADTVDLGTYRLDAMDAPEIVNFLQRPVSCRDGSTDRVRPPSSRVAAPPCRPCPSRRGGCLQGTILEPEVGATWAASAVPGLGVFLTDEASEEIRQSLSGDLLAAATDEDGEFFLEEVPAGTYGGVVGGFGENAVYGVHLAVEGADGEPSGLVIRDGETLNLGALTVAFETDTLKLLPRPLEYCR